MDPLALTPTALGSRESPASAYARTVTSSRRNARPLLQRVAVLPFGVPAFGITLVTIGHLEDVLGRIARTQGVPGSGWQWVLVVFDSLNLVALCAVLGILLAAAIGRPRPRFWALTAGAFAGWRLYVVPLGGVFRGAPNFMLGISGEQMGRLSGLLVALPSWVALVATVGRVPAGTGGTPDPAQAAGDRHGDRPGWALAVPMPPSPNRGACARGRRAARGEACRRGARVPPSR